MNSQPHRWTVRALDCVAIARNAVSSAGGRRAICYNKREADPMGFAARFFVRGANSAPTLSESQDGKTFENVLELLFVRVSRRP